MSDEEPEGVSPWRTAGPEPPRRDDDSRAGDSAASTAAGLRKRALWLCLAGLAAFLAFEAWSLRSYIAAEARPPSWDQSVHLEIALDYREALGRGRWLDALHLAPKPGMPPFPPAYHLALMTVYRGPGPYDPAAVAKASLWVNWAYLALLCAAVFALARELAGDGPALAAAVLIACAPETQSLLHTQLIDLPLTAAACLAYWALWRADGFERWPGSLAFGAAFAFGMLHKWSFFSYMFPAYLAGGLALFRRSARLKALASLGLALALCLPWYWPHLPVLPARLSQAASDFAVPFWEGWAFFSYVFQMADRLGPLLWIHGLVGIALMIAGRGRKHGWLVPAWFLTSYVFWAVVPNRQLRFLMPALPALAMAAAAAFPRPLVWALAAFQVFGAVNFSKAWVGPFQIPLATRPLSLLVSEPPAAQDWKVQDILAEARRLHPPGEPFSNLTLVANDVRFNDPSFVWAGKAMGAREIALRGVNKRLCEFSRFVALKDGFLGPPSVIPGLPEAAAVILNQGGWFQRSYEASGTWPLPDGATAVLFRQRSFSEPPMPEARAEFPEYETGPFEAKGLAIELGPWDRQAAEYRKASVSAAEARLRGLSLSGVAVELEGVVVVPVFAGCGGAGGAAGGGAGGAGAPRPGSLGCPSVSPWADIRFLRMRRLRVKSLKVTAESLKTFIEERAKGLKVESLELDGSVRVRAVFKGVRLGGEADVVLAGGRDRPGLRVTVRSLKAGPLPLPLWLWPRLRTFFLPFEPTPELPFFIELASLTIKDASLSVP